MKYVMLFILVVFFTIGCSSVKHNNGRNSILTKSSVQSPLQATMSVSEPIKGEATCKSWIGGLFRQYPKKQTFGATLQSEEGNIAPNQCTRGALYNALTNNNAEYIVAPKYDTITDSRFCLFGFCLYKVQNVTITGYKANIKGFKNIEITK